MYGLSADELKKIVQTLRNAHVKKDCPVWLSCKRNQQTWE